MKKFDDYIWEEFSEEDQFDRIKHNLNNIRSIMNSHSSFLKMSVKNQFKYCVTISIIATHSVCQHMNENMPLSLPDKEKKFEYSQDYGYVKPKRIPLNHKN